MCRCERTVKAELKVEELKVSPVGDDLEKSPMEEETTASVDPHASAGDWRKNFATYLRCSRGSDSDKHRDYHKQEHGLTDTWTSMSDLQKGL